MRTFIIPALCALALFATSSLSYATAEESTAQAAMDRATTVIDDAWQDEAAPIWY